MKKIKICFSLFNKPQEVELEIEEFGKYMACAFAEESNAVVIFNVMGLQMKQWKNMGKFHLYTMVKSIHL